MQINNNHNNDNDMFDNNNSSSSSNNSDYISRTEAGLGWRGRRRADDDGGEVARAPR